MSKNLSKDLNKEIIKKWVHDIVIGLNLCPFAKAPWDKGNIRFQESLATNEDEMLKDFLDELHLLQMSKSTEVSTTLLYFTHYQEDFMSFNDFVGTCEVVLEKLNLDDLFQLVAFHPKFQFAGLEINDKANLVNSSPIPLVHLIRKEELSLVIKEIDDGEKISFANEKRLKKMSSSEIKNLFPWKYATDKNK